MKTVKLDEIQPGEALAYNTAEGWAFAGDYFSRLESGLIVTKSSFASGAIRFERRTPQGWAVIRGTEVFPIDTYRGSDTAVASDGPKPSVPSAA